jgi:hypothetical protein
MQISLRSWDSDVQASLPSDPTVDLSNVNYVDANSLFQSFGLCCEEDRENDPDEVSEMAKRSKHTVIGRKAAKVFDNGRVYLCLQPTNSDRGRRTRMREEKKENAPWDRV